MSGVVARRYHNCTHVSPYDLGRPLQIHHVEDLGVALVLF